MFLPWRAPWAEEPGRLQSTGPQKVGHNLAPKPHRSFLAERTLEQSSELTVSTLWARPCPRPARGLPGVSQARAQGVCHSLVLHHPPCNPSCDRGHQSLMAGGLGHVSSGHHRGLCADETPISLTFMMSFLQISLHPKLEDSVPSKEHF